MPKLTKRIVDAADIQPTEYFVWDSDIPGFGLRVLPSGRKGYVVQYRTGRRSRRISLGPNTVLTCEQARTRAITIVAAARNGQDPAAERDAGRKAITIKELAERFDKEHIAIRVKASTGKEYRRNLQRFILPALGQLTVTGVTRADVAKFHHDLRHIPYQANRCLEVVSKMFSLSEMWGLRPDGTNPRKHIRKYPEEKRERFLSAAELRRIGEVLREMGVEGVELPSAILAARMLILTGCRLNEIMSLQWSYIDFDSPALRLPDSKTGAKVVHVGQPVVDLLRDAQRIDGNPWVITGTLPGKPLSDLQPFWQRVRARAGVKDVRIHDLRHTFASAAVASGQGLPMIGKLLGHTQVQTTSRYAHLAAEPVRLAPAHVAEMAGVNRSFVYDILRGRSSRPGIDRLADIARVLKVDRDWLIHGIGDVEGPSPFHENPDDAFVAIAHATPRPSMGGGAVVTEDGDTPGRAYHFRQSWIRQKLKASPAQLRIMHVEGDSMAPTLLGGDAVLVDMTRQLPNPPGIFVLDDGMGLVAKRLEHILNSDPPAVRVISDNKLYPEYERTAEEIRIIGRIRWFAREI